MERRKIGIVHFNLETDVRCDGVISPQKFIYHRGHWYVDFWPSQEAVPASGLVTKNEALAWLANRFPLTPTFPNSAEIAVWGYLVQLTELGALYRWRKAEFTVGVYSLSALHTFLTIKGRLDIAAIGLEWTDSARWPSGRHCDHLVCAMLGGSRIPADWHRMINRLRIWGATSPHDACAGAQDFGIDPTQALEFFARAGMLRVI